MLDGNSKYVDLLKDKEKLQEIRKNIGPSREERQTLAEQEGKKESEVDYGLSKDLRKSLSNQKDLREKAQEKAKEILVNNGWGYRNNYWQKRLNNRNERLSFNLVVKASNNTNVTIAEIIKTQLDNQGIRVNIIRASDTQYNNYLQNKNYDMILCTTNLPISPDLTTFFGENNLANYYNEETNRILQEINNITDENILREKYARLEEIYKNDIPYVSICTGKTTVLFGDDLTGDIKSNWYNLYYNLKTWSK